mgnify:CR=1 FL=1|tara:strand:- start:5301 stop:6341 length:1041 start_codon:yes stop_codon:yes gene_type:complete
MLKKLIWKSTILQDNRKIRDVINRLNKSLLQIILVVNKKNKFVGTITDGDLRRGMFDGLNLDDEITKIVNRKSTYVNPGLSYDDAKILMRANLIRHVPIINKNKNIVGLHLLNEISNAELPNTFVIMAGGLGKRLRPFTKNVPKPMLKIGNKPILEHIILKAKSNGFKNFVISVHYLHKIIKDYFKDGKKFSVKIKYIHEKTPKGTAAGLKNLKTKDRHPVLITNGDVISDVDYSKIIEYHKYNKSDATIVIRNITQKNHYGVVRLKKNKIVGFEEKRDFIININTGIYVINKNLLKLLDKKYEDMPNFLEKLRKQNKKVIAYPIYEKWVDIGTKQIFKNTRKKFN